VGKQVCIVKPAGVFKGGRDPQRQQKRAASGIPAPWRRATRARRRGHNKLWRGLWRNESSPWEEWLVARRMVAVAHDCAAWPLCGTLPRTSVAAGRAYNVAPRRGSPVRSGAGSPVLARRRHGTLPRSGIEPLGSIPATPTKICTRGASAAARANSVARAPAHAYSRPRQVRGGAGNGRRAGAPSIFGAGGFGRWVVTHSLAGADFHGHRPTVQIRQRPSGIENEPGASAPHARQRFTPHRPLRLPKEAHLARAPTPGRRPTWARQPDAARSEFENRATPVSAAASSHLLYRTGLRARQLS